MRVPRKNLPDGLYEHLITEDIEAALTQLERGRTSSVKAIDEAELDGVLSRHLAKEIARTISAMPAKTRAQSARELVARVLGQLAEHREGEELDSLQIADPARRLLAVYRGIAPERPATPLSSSTLLTRASSEPRIGHELARELASADRLDLIIAFVTVGGVRQIWTQLEDFARRYQSDDGRERIRILTTTFTGTTEREALDQLAGLPCVTVKVSYDTHRTRLHAKAWLFHRESGLSTAYVGSANLTATALSEGHEWMVKVCAEDLPHVVEKFAGTFNTLWADPEFERYDPKNDIDRTRLAFALGVEQGRERATSLVELRPYPFQEEILDRLTVARQLHGRTRNLVVAATGTGKTVVAAIDYARISAVEGVTPRLLFLAHRREILVRSRDTFRHVLQNASFGELLHAGVAPGRFEHVFSTISSARKMIDELGVEYFTHVIIDECHHMPADSYQVLVPRLRPKQLVGLTATPERSDGKSLLPDFEGHIAAELRLWHALDRQLLAPFDYYGISDGVDLRRVRWSRVGYDLGELDKIYTGHEARAQLVLTQLARRVADAKRIRAIGFCVSVQHAEFMAASFSTRGVPALAVHGGSDAALREDAPRRLRDREVNVLFTCDLYNEGIDLPYVDTLLLLRPTMSATLFMQQLGRGLRLSPGKTSCLVLDFIGQHNEEFRFDATLTALTGVPRPKLREAVEGGFPYLPSGCSVQLDALARSTILDSIREALGSKRKLAEELRDLVARTGEPVRLAQFLEKSGRELHEVYSDNYGWAAIRKEAGVTPNVDDEAADLSRRFGWLSHIDEPKRLRSYADQLTAPAEKPLQLNDSDRARWIMLSHQLNARGVLNTAEKTIKELRSRPHAIAELDELREVLDERVALAEDVYPVPEWPLALHRHYERREIVAAVGFVKAGDKAKVPQGGILQLKEHKRELLFVTLDKTSSGFSPTTRYRDYAISRGRFHWETQSVASVEGSAGQRYLVRANGWSFYLFVRADTHSAYAFLGPVRYESHSGDRPIGITWALESPIPAVLLERFASLASG